MKTELVIIISNEQQTVHKLVMNLLRRCQSNARILKQKKTDGISGEGREECALKDTVTYHSKKVSRVIKADFLASVSDWWNSAC